MPAPEETRNDADVVARLGGDEFVVVCEGADAEAAAAVASRVSAQLCTPFRVDGHDAVVSASIGLATAEGPGADAEQLLRCADLAMYDAKSSTGGVRLYDPDLHATSTRRLRK